MACGTCSWRAPKPPLNGTRKGGSRGPRKDVVGCGAAIMSEVRRACVLHQCLAAAALSGLETIANEVLVCVTDPVGSDLRQEGMLYSFMSLPIYRAAE